MRLTDQTMIVVGGSSGIGLSAVRAAAAAGARVILVGRDRHRLDRAVAECSGVVQAEQVDASKPDALENLFRRVGAFDHLVLAASGGFGASPFEKLSRADLTRGFDGKFWVHWHAAQAALPYLADQGSITFVIANSARTGNPGTSGLAAINGAIAAMVLPLSQELGPIRVNAVSPGVIDTPWWDGRPEAMKARIFSDIQASVPVRRVGRAEDVADAIVFLAGNGYVTGIILDVDGGMRGRMPG